VGEEHHGPREGGAAGFFEGGGLKAQAPRDAVTRGDVGCELVGLHCSLLHPGWVWSELNQMIKSESTSFDLIFQSILN
jgi:hypothetical protein